MKRESITILHVIFLTMTVIGLKNHVTIIPPLLKTVGRDGWVSVFIGALLILPWGFLFIYMSKTFGQKQMKDILKQNIGKIGTRVYIFIMVVSLIALAAFTMRETLQWMTATFLTETPVFFLLLIYTILCIALAAATIQTIAIVNVFVLFGVVVFGFFVAFTNIQVKDYNLLRPFFEDGYLPIVKGAIYPLSGYIELVLLLFILQHVKGKIRYIHFVIMVAILSVLTLGPLVGAIIEFGPVEAARQRYPAYEEWGLVTLGRFIEHLDFLSIYQWLTGAFIRVGLTLYIVVHLLDMHGKKIKIWGILAPVFILACLGLLIMQDPTFVKIKGMYVLPITFIFFFVNSIFLGIVAYRVKKRRSRKRT